MEALHQENVNFCTEESRNDEESKCPSKLSDLYEGQCKEPSESAKTQEAVKKDYGTKIAEHLMKMESRTDVTDFLSQHKVSGDYRAKMVDWIVEVLTTFKCSDQSFFKTIQLLDRYYAEIGQSLGTSSLHMTGIVCMFIATKYEDIVPLLMRTIVNKVGHNKFTKQQVMEKEMEILRVL